jgi:hypothetical protein
MEIAITSYLEIKKVYLETIIIQIEDVNENETMKNIDNLLSNRNNNENTSRNLFESISRFIIKFGEIKNEHIKIIKNL